MIWFSRDKASERKGAKTYSGSAPHAEPTCVRTTLGSAGRSDSHQSLEPFTVPARISSQVDTTEPPQG